MLSGQYLSYTIYCSSGAYSPMPISRTQRWAWQGFVPRSLEEPRPSWNIAVGLSEGNPADRNEEKRVLQGGPQPKSQLRDEVRGWSIMGFDLLGPSISPSSLSFSSRFKKNIKNSFRSRQSNESACSTTAIRSRLLHKDKVTAGSPELQRCGGSDAGLLPSPADEREANRRVQEDK